MAACSNDGIGRHCPEAQHLSCRHGSGSKKPNAVPFSSRASQQMRCLCRLAWHACRYVSLPAVLVNLASSPSPIGGLTCNELSCRLRSLCLCRYASSSTASPADAASHSLSAQFGAGNSLGQSSTTHTRSSKPSTDTAWRSSWACCKHCTAVIVQASISCPQHTCICDKCTWPQATSPRSSITNRGSVSGSQAVSTSHQQHSGRQCHVSRGQRKSPAQAGVKSSKFACARVFRPAQSRWRQCIPMDSLIKAARPTDWPGTTGHGAITAGEIFVWHLDPIHINVPIELDCHPLMSLEQIR